jgi:hypothetical protein
LNPKKLPPETEDEKLARLSDGMKVAQNIDELNNIVEMFVKPLLVGVSDKGKEWLRLEYLSFKQTIKDAVKPDVLEISKKYRKEINDHILLRKAQDKAIEGQGAKEMPAEWSDILRKI